MTVRFNTWVEADSIQEAWGKLVYIASGIDLRTMDVKKKFTATVLEDPEEDKKRTNEDDIALAVKALAEDIKDSLKILERAPKAGMEQYYLGRKQGYQAVLVMMKDHGLIQEEEV